jgi:hypothetical protein
MKKQRSFARIDRHEGQAAVICPKCKKLLSPPERLAKHFPECERRATIKRSVLSRMA